MKKRISTRAKKHVARKPLRSSSRKSTEHLLLLPFSFRRVVLITTGLVLFVLGFALFNKPQVNQAVAGVSIARGLYAQTTVAIPHVDGAVAYNIYYKQTADTKFTNAVRKIPTNVAMYTISYLKKNANYEYKISALNPAGREFWWSEIQTFTATKAL
jgi:hypothetical protein